MYEKSYRRFESSPLRKNKCYNTIVMKRFLSISVLVIVIPIVCIFAYYFIENNKVDNVIPPENKIVIPPKKEDTPKPIEIEKKESDVIAGFVEWTGTDPYPALDLKNTKPELKIAVLDFEEKWESELSVLQAYRPDGYVKHIRSVWEIWRYMNGKEFKSGYNCKNFNHIDPQKVGELNKVQKDFINKEAKRHSFTTGDTPPACMSDHALGIAVDITPPTDLKEYKKWIETANSVGLCHYIDGDEPHFGLTKYLPKGTDCFVY